MYADHLRSRRIDPVGLGGAAIIGGAIVAALINVAPQIMIHAKDPDLGIFRVDPYVPPPPPVDVKKPQKPVPKSDEKIFTTKPLVASDTSDNHLDTTTIEPTTFGTTVIVPAATIGDPPVAPPPPFIAADVDPRYADDFQPPYPADKLRAEEEGMITVRVQIGADGRVKAIDPVGKADASFFDATRRQALRLWRFKPATRGGVPVESAKTMTVRFRIT
jgi:protein TonB